MSFLGPRTARDGGGRALGPLSVRHVRWVDFDWPALLVALGLLAFGLVFLSAMSGAESELGRDRVRIESHLQKLAVALPFLALGVLVRPRFLRRNAARVYALCVLLLVAVALFGQVRNNARRWIETPIFDLQPSELAKLGLVLVLARALCRNRLRTPGEWALPLLLALVPMGLVALQPDLGTALTVVPITLGMMYLAGARASVLLSMLLLAGAGGYLGWRYEIGVRDYQAERIDTWLASLDAESLIEAKRGPAFHAYHARLSIGDGGLFGAGLGRGIANETGILPERASDSIFAVIAGEAGFVGAVALLFLYALLVVLLMRSAGELRDRFARLVVGGVALYFAAHLFIHTGVNLGLLPMTGLTLPLISTGGSSMLASCLALGLALGLAANAEPTLDEDAFRSY